jgi:hypothetical protein
MLLLPSLFVGRIRRTKTLVNYSKSHVVISKQYLGHFMLKNYAKEIVDKEREIRR